MGAGLIDDLSVIVFSVPFCPCHFVYTILSNTILSVYHFVHTILSVPFCPLPFCPYHFVRTILSATILSGHPRGTSHTHMSIRFRRQFIGLSPETRHVFNYDACRGLG